MTLQNILQMKNTFRIHTYYIHAYVLQIKSLWSNGCDLYIYILDKNLRNKTTDLIL